MITLIGVVVEDTDLGATRRGDGNGTLTGVGEVDDRLTQCTPTRLVVKTTPGHHSTPM